MENSNIVNGILAVGIVCIIIGLITGYQFTDKKEPVPCNCKTSEQIISLHEKRSMWVDKLEYPTRVLTKKEKDSLIDSITKYTNLLK